MYICYAIHVEQFNYVLFNNFATTSLFDDRMVASFMSAKLPDFRVACKMTSLRVICHLSVLS